MSVVSIDIKQQHFHFSIRRAMVRSGIDVITTNYIMDNYADNTTCLQYNGKPSAEISVKRGVKQDDPLSPMLFNFLIDEAITEIC